MRMLIGMGYTMTIINECTSYQDIYLSVGDVASVRMLM